MDSNPYRPSTRYVDLLTSQHGFSYVEDSVQLSSSSQVPVFGTQGAEASSCSQDTPGDRSSRRMWTPVEDMVLISSWLNTSKDPVVENEQRCGAVWKRIAVYFAASPKVAATEHRESENCKQHWHKINDQVNIFCGAFEAATREKTSEQNENDVLNKAHQIFSNNHGKKIILEHAWKELKNDQKCSSLVGFFSKSHNPLLSARLVRAGDASSIRCLASSLRGKNKKLRLDEACLERYQEYSRTLIQSWILQGKLLVDGKRASKAGMPVANGVSIKITAEVPKYVCRGGLKLEAAIEKLDIVCFVMVLRMCMVLMLVMVRWLIKSAMISVSVIERTNLRYLPGLPQKVDVVTLDLSFISILKVMPAVMNVMNDDTTLVTLVKPQFEARRSQVGRGGIVRDPEVHQEVLEKIINGIERYGFTNKGFIESPIKGADGNIEFLVRFDRGTVKGEEEEDY
ncbi:hypothetical protein Bca101_082939 [Brassica carinata]